MGKLNDSPLSGSSGRTGRLVVANVAGTEILRVSPRKRTTPPTPKQVLVQSRMKKCYDFISIYKGYASLYFGVRSGMRSRYTNAMTNLLNAFKLDLIALTITPALNEIEFSKGDLLAAVPSGLSSPAVGSLTLDWFNNAATDPARATDQLQLLYFADSELKPVFMENISERQDGTLTVSLPPNLQGKTVHVWIAFRTADLVIVSNSTYVGSVLIA